MERIKKLKVKQADGSFSSEIPLGADSKNVDFEDGQTLDAKIQEINSSIESLTDKTVSYNDVTDKPSINGVSLEGEVSSANLQLKYTELEEKPKINGAELTGNLVLDDVYKPQYVKDYTLQTGTWVDGEGSASYTITAPGITTAHRVNVYMDLANQEKISDGYTDTAEGQIKIYTSTKPTDTVVVNLEIVLTQAKEIS